MGYENGKIYKIQCEDGYYYYGSCITTLERRSYTHRLRAKTNTTCLLYKHIKDKCWKIVLVKNVSCSNRNELRREEDLFIQQSKDDMFCLNDRFAILNIEKDKLRKKKWYEDNKERILQKLRDNYQVSI